MEANGLASDKGGVPVVTLGDEDVVRLATQGILSRDDDRVPVCDTTSPV